MCASGISEVGFSHPACLIPAHEPSHLIKAFALFCTQNQSISIIPAETMACPWWDKDKRGFGETLPHREEQKGKNNVEHKVEDKAAHYKEGFKDQNVQNQQQQQQQKGFELGFETGYEIGYEDGYDSGYDLGFDQGYEYGHHNSNGIKYGDHGQDSKSNIEYGGHSSVFGHDSGKKSTYDGDHGYSEHGHYSNNDRVYGYDDHVGYEYDHAGWSDCDYD